MKKVAPDIFFRLRLKQFDKQVLRLFLVLTIRVFFGCGDSVSPIVEPTRLPSRQKENLRTVEATTKVVPKLDRPDILSDDTLQTTPEPILWVVCCEATADYAVAYVDFFPHIDLTGGMEVVVRVQNSVPGIRFQVQLLPSRDEPGSPVGLSPIMSTLSEGICTIRIPLTEFGVDVSHVERLTIHHGRRNVLNQELNAFTQTGMSSFLADNAEAQAVVGISSVECVQANGARVLLTPEHRSGISKVSEVKFWETFVCIVIGVVLLLGVTLAKRRGSEHS